MKLILKKSAIFSNLTILFILLTFFQIEAVNPAPYQVFKNNSFKIKTIEGLTYDFAWYEVMDGYILSILNTERYVIDTCQIERIVLSTPEKEEVPVDVAHKYDGSILVFGKDDDGREIKHRFIMSKLVNGKLIGLQKSGIHQAKVIIPIDQIVSIRAKYQPSQQLKNNTEVVLHCAAAVVFWYLIEESASSAF